MKIVSAPLLDEAMTGDAPATGQLAPIAAKVLMKVMYAAHFARYVS